MMIYKRAIGALAALAVAGLGVLILATPAQAQAGLAESFTAFDWPDPAGGPVPAANSTVTGEAIVLTKVDGAVGTDATTPNLGLVGDQLTVDYTLTDLTQTAATGVRFFAYSDTSADVSVGGQAPNVVAIADATSGTLTLDLAGGAIGTVGVTYDASNSSTGTVTFASLKLDGEPVPFVKSAPPEPCEFDDSLAADDPKCKAPASPEPTTSPSADPAPGVGGSADDKLPVTGANLPIYAGAGAAVIGVGAGLVALAKFRRRQPTFTVE